MRRTPRGSRVEDYYRQVADSLVRQMESGTAPWTEAWGPGRLRLPYNIKSGKSYRGGNSVWLASTAKRRDFSDARWGTYKQIKELGGQVRRGQKGCPILFWQFQTSKLARDRDGAPVLDDKGNPVYVTEPLSSPRCFRYTVFNAQQCKGLPPEPSRPPAVSWQNHEEAERLIRRTGVAIDHTSEQRAYFDLQRDRIIMPHREQFQDGPSYYQSLLHEMAHWTGHPDRLNRRTLVQGIAHGYNSDDYAREELRAEISSMMTGDRLNVGHDPSRIAAYVKAWVNQLEKDPREIYRASKDAQEISDYLLARGRWRDQGQQRAAEPGVPEQARPRSDLMPAGATPVSARTPERLPNRKPVTLPWPGRTGPADRSTGPAR